jgi:glycosyltransferase involved in cell wall biosynthesis
LPEQLDSLVSQLHANWAVWVSDDGSTDATRSVLERFLGELGTQRLSILPGPTTGFVANFLSLACNPRISADYYAFADQDDVWEEDKLARALAWLETIPSHVPALHCGRTRTVDAANKEIGLSPLFPKTPVFANALVQSIAGANTMVFNEAARQLLCVAGKDVAPVSHDWWLYQLVTGCGGQVCYDPHPAVRYRQHEGNLVGTNNTWPARFVRMRMLLRGGLRDWSELNVAALQRMRPHLTPHSLRCFDEFCKARYSSLLPRLLAMRRSTVHRQTLLGNLALIAASLLKKI